MEMKIRGWRVIAFLPVDDHFLIVAEAERSGREEWVVASYFPVTNPDEWENGRYFNDRTDALTHACLQYSASLPIGTVLSAVDIRQWRGQSWTDVNAIRRATSTLSSWAVEWQKEWVNSRQRRNQTFTKWDLLNEQERAALDATPHYTPGTKNPGSCSGCGAELPTEGAFARHFTIRDPHLFNIGSCPGAKKSGDGKS